MKPFHLNANEDHSNVSSNLNFFKDPIRINLTATLKKPQNNLFLLMKRNWGILRTTQYEKNPKIPHIVMILSSFSLQKIEEWYPLEPQIPIFLVFATVLHWRIGIEMNFIATTIRNVRTVWPLLVIKPICRTIDTATKELENSGIIM